jgi:hypothetical protein
MPLSTFLNGGTAIQLRGLQWLSLSDVGHYVTQVSTDDQGGGVTQVWAAGSVDIPCRVDPIGTGRERGMVGGMIDERTTHVVTVPAGSTVTADSRFVIDGRGTFEVTAVRDRTAEHFRVVEVVAA